jgi:hypothetical protein
MRLIDAEELECLFNEQIEHGATDAFDAFDDALQDATTVDAVVVVRCKDCKHSTLPSELTQRYGVPGTLTCHNRCSPCNRRNVGGNDFCSYGERKDCGDADR